VVQKYVESAFRPFSGWPLLGCVLGALAAGIASAVGTVHQPHGRGWLLAALILCAIAFVLLPVGFFIVRPNEARTLILFGRYRGTVRQEGFYWTNPFTQKAVVSLKVHNFNSETLKVNDLAGNPIEIAAVVVWRVRDTAKASFEVEDHQDFVEVQSEAAVRTLASSHPYDEGLHDGVDTTLRGSAHEVAEELRETLQQRLDVAGIEVVEARLSHLAYAPEIASAMLQRQQASAIIAARTKIVEGAVGMVEMALEKLDQGRLTEMGPESRAALVGNLLVVLCGGQAPTPVLDTGSPS
jgi:regulator of protease activity HflC (stomatin/prohibitin superfamily)